MSKHSYSSSSKNYGDEGLGLFGEAFPDKIKIEHAFGKAFPDKIKLEHVFTLKFSDKWEKPVRRWIDKWLDLSKQYAESFHFIAVGIGAYFFLLGVSKIVKAGNKPSGNDEASNHDEASSSTKKIKTKSKSQKGKEIISKTVKSEPASRSAKTKESNATTKQPSTVQKTISEKVLLSKSDL